MLKDAYGLSFAQIGLITLTMQITSSVLQPAVGYFADRRPQPYSLAVGMGVTLVGLWMLAVADSYPLLLSRYADGAQTTRLLAHCTGHGGTLEWRA